MLEDLLLYQEEDGKLRAIELEIAATEEKKKYFTARKFLEKAPEKLNAMDARAAELRASYERLQRKCDEFEEALKDYENIAEIIGEQGGDTSFYKRSATQVRESIRSLENEISRLNTNMQQLSREYAAAKSQTIQMQRQYKEYKDKYEAIKASRKEEMDRLNARMKEIAPRIPPKMLERYTAKRKERLYPVVCEVKDARCPQCGVELVILEMNKLRSGKLTECESCRRILFMQQTK